MSLLQDVRKIEATPLSFDQLMGGLGALKSQCNLCFIDDLPSTVADPDVFGGKKFALVLWTLYRHGATDIRHWTLLWQHGQHSGKTLFFDSLGNSPKELFRKTKEPHKGFYTWIQGKKIDSNHTKLQRSSHLVNTCGSHVCLRIIEHERTHRGYARWLKASGMTPDATVGFLFYVPFHRLTEIS